MYVHLKKVHMQNLVSVPLGFSQTFCLFWPPYKKSERNHTLFESPNMEQLESEKLGGILDILILATRSFFNFPRLQNLNNYFDFHVCLSFHASVRPSVRPCVQKLTSIPAVVQQNFMNKRCLVCVMSEKYPFWVTFRTLVLWGK